MGPLGTYQLFAIDGADAGGIMTRIDPNSRPSWTYYFVVAEAQAAITKITEAGGQILNGPQAVPGGSWVVQALDPQGLPFAVVAPVA